MNSVFKRSKKCIEHLLLNLANLRVLIPIRRFSVKRYVKTNGFLVTYVINVTPSVKRVILNCLTLNLFLKRMPLRNYETILLKSSYKEHSNICLVVWTIFIEAWLCVKSIHLLKRCLLWFVATCDTKSPTVITRSALSRGANCAVWGFCSICDVAIARKSICLMRSNCSIAMNKKCNYLTGNYTIFWREIIYMQCVTDRQVSV